MGSWWLIRISASGIGMCHRRWNMQWLLFLRFADICSSERFARAANPCVRKSGMGYGCRTPVAVYLTKNFVDLKTARQLFEQGLGQSARMSSLKDGAKTMRRTSRAGAILSAARLL